MYACMCTYTVFLNVNRMFHSYQALLPEHDVQRKSELDGQLKDTSG